MRLASIQQEKVHFIERTEKELLDLCGVTTRGTAAAMEVAAEVKEGDTRAMRMSGGLTCPLPSLFASLITCPINCPLTVAPARPRTRL